MRGTELQVGDRSKLSPREAEVMLWTAEGKSAADIASILGISERTANVHVQAATRKLDASNKTHAVSRALLLKILLPICILIACLALRGSSHRESPEDQAAEFVD